MRKKLISLALSMLLPAAAAISAAALGGEAGTWHAYVYTSDGKNLNLRSEPNANNPPIATIPYGASVHLHDYIDKTWVEVDYNDHHGYVMGRYLTYEQPPAKPKPDPKPKVTPKPASALPTQGSGSVNDLFRGFYFTSYTVQVRSSIPGGFVHMRWAPTQEADPIRDYHPNDALTVIAQNDEWAQVTDPLTGFTGFMMRSFLADAWAGGAPDDSGS